MTQLPPAPVTIVCSKCGLHKALSEFYRRKDNKTGLYNRCISCVRTSEKKRRADNRETRNKRAREYLKNNVAAGLLGHARRRAEDAGVPFCLKAEDIHVPEFCPVLGIRLERNGQRGPRHSSPTLDRFVPSRGYVVGNVHVISHLANSIKNSATPEQIMAVAKWAERTAKEQAMSPREIIKSLNVPVVGITGKKLSGKSTFAKCLGESFEWHIRLAFADPIRSMSLAIFGSAYETQEDKSAHDAYWAEKLGDGWSTGRHVLQRLGTDIGRKMIHENIWIWSMERRLLALVDRLKDPNHPKPVITIEDCRFANECEMVKEMGGTIVRLVNTAGAPNNDSHESESGVPDSLVDHEYEIASAEDVKRIANAFAFCMLRS